MPIAQLPEEVTRLLGSSVAISDAPSLVKELLDNAIDAGATSVGILISGNTVDKIQVRDNGAGIPPSDLESLGRRAHTSKLQSFEELGKGVSTLGFRGEALSSANCIAKGGLLVTTRTSSERVATQVRLIPQEGGVKERRSVSAPVGTTIAADSLFDMIPVRKQQAAKESRKSLARIRDLLLACALARPGLKLNMKVPGEPKQEWNYSPVSHPTTENVVLQMFGKSLYSQCTYTELKRAADADYYTSKASNPSLTLESFMPLLNCDVGPIKGKGAFLSIDSRPVTSIRGTGKKIAAIYKSQLRQATGCSKLQAPFMQLNIRCSPGSYDPNIATLKDEVLFLDEERIINCFEELCQVLSQKSGAAPEDNIGVPAAEAAITLGGTEVRSGQVNEGEPISADQIPRVEAKLAEEMAPRNEDWDVLRLLQAESFGDDRGPPYVPREETQASPYGRDGSYTEGIEQIQAADAEARTVVNVNMARKVSDVTDEDAMVDTLTVQVPAQPIMPNKCNASLSSTKAGSDRKLTSPKMADIHSYFRPQSKQDFEIAVNDTATEEDRGSNSMESQCPESNPARRPLQPIRNEHPRQVNRRTEQRSPSPPLELEMLRSQIAPQGDLDMPRLRPNITSRMIRGEGANHVTEGTGAGSLPSSPRYEPPSPSLFVPDSPNPDSSVPDSPLPDYPAPDSPPLITPPSSSSRALFQRPRRLVGPGDPRTSAAADGQRRRGAGGTSAARRQPRDLARADTGRQKTVGNALGNMVSRCRRDRPAIPASRAPREPQRKMISPYDLIPSVSNQS